MTQLGANDHTHAITIGLKRGIIEFDISQKQGRHLLLLGVSIPLVLSLAFLRSIVGTLIALVEWWTAWTLVNDPWMPIVLATFGGTAGMIGGAWSNDVQLFGRKHINT